MKVRRFAAQDIPAIWALSTIPNIGETGDPTAPLDLPAPAEAPARFSDLGDVSGSFLAVGGDFVVAELDGRTAGMGGIRPNNPRQAEVLHVRVHPALRRLGIGTAVMTELERRAIDLGFDEMHLDTASNQPEALAFYRSLGYHALGQETRPEWQWTLQYFTKTLSGGLRNV